MGSLVLGVAGAVVGSVIPGVGTALGWAIGSALGSALFPAKQPNQYSVQQQLSSLKITGTDYGQSIGWGKGTVGAIAGQDIWHSDLQTIQSVAVSGGGGGKGGGGGGQTFTITYTYQIDIWFMLLDNEAVGIRRAWDNGALFINASDDADAATVIASGSTSICDRLTFYSGVSTQLPDPTYETAVGADNAVALRGRCSVFLQGWKLGQSGTIRNLTWEVVCGGSSAPIQIGATLEGTSSTDKYALSSAVAFHQPAALSGLPSLGMIWVAHYTGGSDYMLQFLNPRTGAVSFELSTAYIIPGAFNTIGAIDFDNSALVISGTKIYKLNGYVGTLKYVETLLSVARVVVDLNRDLWVIAGGSVYHVAITSWDNPATFTEIVPTGVTSGFNHFARNASAIPGRIYGVMLFSGGTIGYVNMITLDFVSIGVVSAAPQYTPFLVGGDSNLYDHDSATNTIYQYGQDGGLFGTLVVPILGSVLDVFLLDSNGMLWVKGDDPLDPFVAIDTVTMTVDHTIEANGFETAIAELETGSIAFFGRTATAGQFGKLGLSEGIDRISEALPSVADVQSEIFLRSGLTAAQFDVTALSSITKLVRSFLWIQGNGRAASEQLMSTHFYQAVSSNKITCTPRGSAAVDTIDYLELSAADNNEQAEPFSLQEANDLEYPASLGLTYLNASDDYQPDTQMSDRLITATTDTVDVATVVAGMTPSEAKAVVDTWAMDKVVSRFSGKLSLLGDHSAKQAGDVLLVTDEDSNIFRVRIIEVTDSYPVLSYKVVLDDASVLTSQGITTADYSSSTTVAGPADALLRLLDIPILQDSDDDAGVYVSTKGSSSPYPGSAIYKSNDNVEFAFKLTIDESGIFGVTTSALGNHTRGRVFDMMGRVTVNVGDILSSSTRAALLASESVNAMLIGDEIVQFIAATISSAGVYVLTGLLRGCRGTEWAMGTHAIGERVQLLSTTGMRRLPFENSEIGVLRYIKGVTKGRAISSATAQEFTDQAIGLKPFSPYHGKVSRDVSNNATIDWIRRTRLTRRIVGTAGINVPLGEDQELYDIEIYSAAYAALLRAAGSLASPQYVYSAANQTADGLTPGDPIYAKIYQRSGTVGRGYALALAA